MTKIRNFPKKNDLFAYSKSMVKHGWTPGQSSDGYQTFHSIVDGYSALTTDGYGVGGFSNPGAWLVISKTVNSKHYSFCIQTDGYQGYRIKVTSLSNFTLGTPGLLVTPSSSHETVLLGSGTDTSPVYQKILSFRGIVNDKVLNMNFTLSNKVMNFSLIDRIQAISTMLPTVNKIL